MKRRLLVIGGGIEQVRAYELAREMGYDVVGSDMSEEAPALALASHFLRASTRDPEETVAAVLPFHEHTPIHGVMTLANDVPLTVAEVARALDLPGPSVETGRIASDKLLMKQAFEGSGVPVPPYREVASTAELRRALEEWGAPIVVKPVDGRGARGVLRVTAETDFEWAFTRALGFSDKGRVIAEDFIPGLQLSTESFVTGGRCYTASWSERNYEHLDRFAPYIIENGGVLPATLTPDEIDAVESVVTSAAAAMLVTEGPVKGDIVLGPDGPVVIEMAARLSGGYLCTDQIPLARGVDLVRQTIHAAMGEPIDPADLVPEHRCFLGVRHFFPPPGRVRSVSGFEEMCSQPWIAKAVLYAHPGDLIEPPSDHTKRAGFVFTTGDTADEAAARAVDAAAAVRFGIEPG